MSLAPRPGRVDPTVRGLLRGFVSPPLADRWAARLQPIAVADHRAAVTGAVTLLLDEVGVDPADLAVALVEDARWSSPDVGALLGLTALEVRIALAAGGRSTPRTPRHQREPWLLHTHGRPRPAATGDGGRDRDGPLGATPAPRTATAHAPEVPDHDVELRSRLPRRTTAAADRRPALVLVVLALLAVAGLAAGATAPVTGTDDVAPVASPSPQRPTPSPPTTPPPTPSPSATSRPPQPSPTETQPPPTPGTGVEELRLVTVDDVLAGRPSPADVGATFTDVTDVRVWGALTRPAGEAVVVRVAVTAPDGRRSVRPVLLPMGVRTFALSLPAELGAAPGRWLVTAALGDGPVLRHEAELVPATPDG